MGKARTVNFRLDADLESRLSTWMEKNPGFTLSQVGNLALRSFISKPQVLEPVSIEDASDDDFLQASESMMSVHADAMERLK